MERSDELIFIQCFTTRKTHAKHFWSEAWYLLVESSSLQQDSCQNVWVVSTLEGLVYSYKYLINSRFRVMLCYISYKSLTSFEL